MCLYPGFRCNTLRTSQLMKHTYVRFWGQKKYMPKKPTKWGIKAFSLACSTGYLLNTLVYTGADTLSDA